jgi:hypothetical protein
LPEAPQTLIQASKGQISFSLTFQCLECWPMSYDIINRQFMCVLRQTNASQSLMQVEETRQIPPGQTQGSTPKGTHQPLGLTSTCQPCYSLSNNWNYTVWLLYYLAVSTDSWLLSDASSRTEYHSTRACQTVALCYWFWKSTLVSLHLIGNSGVYQNSQLFCSSSNSQFTNLAEWNISEITSYLYPTSKYHHATWTVQSTLGPHLGNT